MDRQTHRTTTVTLAAHARRGLIILDTHSLTHLTHSLSLSPPFFLSPPLCSHEFHRNCVDPWLKLKQTCPLCKNNIIEKTSSTTSTSTTQRQRLSHTNPLSRLPSPSPSTDSAHSSTHSATDNVQQQEMRLLAGSLMSAEVAVNIEEDSEEGTFDPGTQIV